MFQELEAHRISRKSAREGGHLNPQETFLVLISVTVCIDSTATEQTEGWSQWKISMTPSGIEAATLRFVAQCPNQLSLRVHLITSKDSIFQASVLFGCAPSLLGNSTPLLETIGLSRKAGHQFPSDVMPLQNTNTRTFCGFISLNILYFWNAREVRVTTVPCHSAPWQPICLRQTCMFVQINCFVRYSD